MVHLRRHYVSLAAVVTGSVPAVHFAGAFRETGVETIARLEAGGEASKLRALYRERLQRKKEVKKSPCGEEVHEVFKGADTSEEILQLADDPVWDQINAYIAMQTGLKQAEEAKIAAASEKIKTLKIKVEEAAWPLLDGPDAKALFQTVCQEQFGASDCVSAGCGITKEDVSEAMENLPDVEKLNATKLVDTLATNAIGLGNYKKILTETVTATLRNKKLDQGVLRGVCDDLVEPAKDKHHPHTIFMQCSTFCRHASATMVGAMSTNTALLELEEQVSHVSAEIVDSERTHAEASDKESECGKYQTEKEELHKYLQKTSAEEKDFNEKLDSLAGEEMDQLEKVFDMEMEVEEATETLKDKDTVMIKKGNEEKTANEALETAKEVLANITKALKEWEDEASKMQQNFKDATDAKQAANEVKMQLIKELETINDVTRQALTGPIKAVMELLDEKVPGYPILDETSELIQANVEAKSAMVSNTCMDAATMDSFISVKLGGQGNGGEKGYLVMSSEKSSKDLKEVEALQKENKQNVEALKVKDKNATDWQAANFHEPIGMIDLCNEVLQFQWAEDTKLVVERIHKLQRVHNDSPVKTIRDAKSDLESALTEANNWGPEPSPGPDADEMQGTLRRFMSKFRNTALYTQYLRFWKAGDKDAYFFQMLGQLEIVLQNIDAMIESVDKRLASMRTDLATATAKVEEKIRQHEEAKGELKLAKEEYDAAAQALQTVKDLLVKMNQQMKNLEASTDKLTKQLDTLKHDAETHYKELVHEQALIQMDARLHAARFPAK